MKNRSLIYLVMILMFACCGIIFCDALYAVDHAELAPADVNTTPLQEKMQKRVSVDFRNMPMEDVLRMLADQADIDIVKSPEVTGEVTATLTNIPVSEVLNNILAAHGYGYIESRNMIRVVPLDQITQQAERLVNKIYQINYADVVQVETALKKFLSPRGSISSNPGTSNIIITDTESKIKAIDDFIQEIDRETPQVIVEARIYDIISDHGFDLGIQWGVGTNTTFTDGRADETSGNRTDPFIRSNFQGGADEAGQTDGLIRVGWLNDSIDIDALLRAEQQSIDSKLLANPKVLVLDNEIATFKIIKEIPYQELNTSSEGGSFGTTEFREVGVKLYVTPHITRDEKIRLNLKPEFSVQTGSVDIEDPTTDDKIFFSQPIIDRREADTTLLIKDGTTVVLGGLKRKDTRLQKNKIPFLGDCPLIGPLFRFEGEEVINSELLVFVTPHIVTDYQMAPDERQKYNVTEFEDPNVSMTKYEKGELNKCLFDGEK